MRKRITAFIDKQVGLGGQAYVVCPLIEDSENAETKLKSAEQHAKDLQKLLPHRRVAVLHGRMKNAEKDQIMRDLQRRNTIFWSQQRLSRSVWMCRTPI